MMVSEEGAFCLEADARIQSCYCVEPGHPETREDEALGHVS